MAKVYEEQDFTDDFLFCKILTSKPELCKELLEIILDVKIREINYLNKQENIEITSDGRGIRLDVYVEDADNTVYDIEMQTTTQKDLPKRSRYYQGMIDLNLIERGARYSALKKSIIIFICTQDPFGKKQKVYHFSNRCHEIPELELKDETSKVFLNVKGTEGTISEELEDFLGYLQTRQAKGKFAKEIEEQVKNAKNKEEWRLEYMTLLQRDLQNREEGRAEGRAEERMQIVFNMYNTGMTPEKIAELTLLPLEEVQALLKGR